MKLRFQFFLSALRRWGRVGGREALSGGGHSRILGPPSESLGGHSKSRNGPRKSAYGPKSLKLPYSIMNLNTTSLPSW